MLRLLYFGVSTYRNSIPGRSYIHTRAKEVKAFVVLKRNNEDANQQTVNEGVSTNIHMSDR